MNAILWAWHIGVLYYAWPLLRHWWDGAVVLGRTIERKRWAVVVSALTPPLAAIWLLPMAIAHRHDLREQEKRQPSAWAKRRAVDVAYWREQAESGDPVAQQNAIELLKMWQVPVVEPKTRPRLAYGGVVPVVVQALPGAHEYSHGCGCRNCVRARALDSHWRGSGALISPGCHCGATSDVEMCTVRTALCGRL